MDVPGHSRNARLQISIGVLVFAFLQLLYHPVEVTLKQAVLNDTIFFKFTLGIRLGQLGRSPLESGEWRALNCS